MEKKSCRVSNLYIEVHNKEWAEITFSKQKQQIYILKTEKKR